MDGTSSHALFFPFLFNSSHVFFKRLTSKCTFLWLKFVGVAYIIIQLITYCLDVAAADAAVPDVASVARVPGAIFDDDLSETWFILST